MGRPGSAGEGQVPGFPAVPPSPEAPGTGLSPASIPRGRAGSQGGAGLAEAAASRPTQAESGRVGARGWQLSQASPGRRQAGSTFLTHWVRLGLAQPGVWAPPGRAATGASSAHGLVRNLPGSCQERVWELLPLQILARRGAAWGVGGRLLEPPSHNGLGSGGTPAHPLLVPPALVPPFALHLESRRLKLNTGGDWSLGLSCS